MNILEERIKDGRFLDLIRKALNAGYVENGTMKASLIGTPQGSIISPILSNIYMDKFDKFVENLATQFDRGKKRKLNPAYVTLQNKKRWTKSVEEKQRLHKLMLQTPSILIADPDFRRLFYVRYADD